MLKLKHYGFYYIKLSFNLFWSVMESEFYLGGSWLTLRENNEYHKTAC